MFRFINLVLLVVISMVLTACGGGGGSTVSVNGVNYNINSLALSPSTITSSTGTTTVSVRVQQQTSSTISDYSSATVTFSSTCTLQGKASFSTTSVSGGTYTSTYTNNGCSSSDTITASALIVGAEHTISPSSKTLTITNTTTSSGVIQLGYHNGTTFIPSVIYGGGSSTNIAANSTQTLRVNLWDTTNGTPYTTDMSSNINFISNCGLTGKATIGSISNLGNGVYTAVYTDQGCTLSNAQNTITATATVNGQSTNSATTTLGTTAVTSATVQMGSCTNNASCTLGTFTANTLKPASTPLSAGGQTTIDGVLFDTAGNYYNSLTQITLSSVCALAGKATISNTSATNGQFSAVYKDNGCATTDTITATATVSSGSSLTATTTLVVAADSVGSIEFVDATPTSIAVQGSGLTEQSTVRFRIIGSSTATPISGQTVSFALSTTAGGVTVNPTSTTSDSNGYVTTTVSAGTAPTPVRVTATSGGISTQSSTLSISTTLPDQPHFSMAATTPNPTGAWDVQETNTTINVLLADQFSNPPPAGTVVNFRAESGQITPTCSTDANGACNVTWTTQTANNNPPLPYDGTTSVGAVCYNNPTSLSNLNNKDQSCINKAGRVTIMAWISGSEGFIDNNNDGIFNDGDTFATTPTNYANPPVTLSDYFYFDRRDLEPPYLDANFNYVKETGAANSGIPNEYEVPDAQTTSSDYTGKYNGVLCNRTDNSCSTQKNIYIFRNMEIVMPTRSSNVSFWNAAGSATVANIIAAGSYHALIQDNNGNTMGDGTSITIGASASSVNLTVTATPPTVDKQAGYGHAVGFSVSRADPLQAATGSVEVTITSGGIITTRSIAVSI